MEKLSVEELREKEFNERAERAERIKNTISLFRKIACVLAVMIAAAFIFFHVRKCSSIRCRKKEENTVTLSGG